MLPNFFPYTTFDNNSVRSGSMIAADVSMDMMTIQNIVKLGFSREHLGLISVRVPKIETWKSS
jgi:hypothetical protein